MDCKNDCDILRPLTRQYRFALWNHLKPAIMKVLKRLRTKPPNQHKYFTIKEMNYHTDRTIMLCVIVVLATIDALITLLSIFKKGIFIDQRTQLMDKTNRQLKEMLIGVKGISSLKKTELVELVLAS